MFGDNAPRSSTVPISSAIMETAWDITLSERGSNMVEVGSRIGTLVFGS
jgi:hypothetical protein